MTTQEVIVPLPESLYVRLQQVARATKRPLADVILHAVEMGSPPDWEDVPADFQVELAALDRLDDDTLWEIARGRDSITDSTRYQILLDKNANSTLSDAEQRELIALRAEADRFMLRKAHAAALLRWRGHSLPPAEKL